MCELYNILKQEKTYYDRKNYESLQDYKAAIAVSSTVYVGNLSFYSTQDSIRELFALAGKVVEIIMGIDDEGHPCGFCFVIYETHEEASYAVEYLSKSRLDERVIRVDWDPGYKKGRERGRGSGGQQRRDDFRTKEDMERPRKRNNYEGQQKQRDFRRDRGGYRDGGYRGERGDRGGERGDRGDRWENRGGNDRWEGRGDRGDRGQRGDRYNRGDREDRDHRRRDYDKQDRQDKQYPQRAQRTQRPEKKAAIAENQHRDY